VEEYRVHLRAGRIIVHGERIIFGLQGGNIGMVTVIPEVTEKKCQRNTKSFFRGNVVVIVDVLEKARFEMNEDGSSTTSLTTQDHVRINDRLLRLRPINSVKSYYLPDVKESVAVT
jgi:hypothetical protein